MTEGVPIIAENIFDDLATYLNPRLIDLGGSRPPKHELNIETYKEMASDIHRIVFVSVKAGEMLIEDDLKRLAKAINAVDKKYRIKGFLKEARGLKVKMGDNTHVLVSYIALTPQDADNYLKENPQ